MHLKKFCTLYNSEDNCQANRELFQRETQCQPEVIIYNDSNLILKMSLKLPVIIEIERMVQLIRLPIYHDDGSAYQIEGTGVIIIC